MRLATPEILIPGSTSKSIPSLKLILMELTSKIIISIATAAIIFMRRC
jgi:hypothetical protein